MLMNFIMFNTGLWFLTKNSIPKQHMITDKYDMAAGLPMDGFEGRFVYMELSEPIGGQMPRMDTHKLQVIQDLRCLS